MRHSILQYAGPVARLAKRALEIHMHTTNPAEGQGHAPTMQAKSTRMQAQSHTNHYLLVTIQIYLFFLFWEAKEKNRGKRNSDSGAVSLARLGFAFS
jgi:hypothetical protein